MNFLLSINEADLPIIIFACIIFVPIIILAIIVAIKQIRKAVIRNKNLKENNNQDYKEYFGGTDNIENIEVVLSRVNVTVKDLDKVNLQALNDKGIGILVVGNVVKCASQEFADMVSKTLK